MNGTGNARLHGKRVLLFGGATGLGHACARAMLAEGARVFLSGRREQALQAGAADLGLAGAHAAGDATDQGDVERVTRAAADAMGGLDTVVVSSGISGITRIDDAALADVSNILDTNLLPLFLTTQAALPFLREAGKGSVIAIASTSGIAGMAGRLAYCASKAGVIGMVKAIALDLAAEGIRVNAISPSLVLTDLSRNVIGREADPDGALRRREAQHPMGRLGRPEEIAAMAVHLASHEAAWTTGQNFVIDGGFTVP